MSRLVVTLILAIVLVVGGLYLLAGRDGERPMTRVEKQVSLGNLQ